MVRVITVPVACKSTDSPLTVYVAGDRCLPAAVRGRDDDLAVSRRHPALLGRPGHSRRR